MEILDVLALLDEVMETLDTIKVQAKEAQEQAEYDRLNEAIDYICYAIDLLA